MPGLTAVAFNKVVAGLVVSVHGQCGEAGRRGWKSHSCLVQIGVIES